MRLWCLVLLVAVTAGCATVGPWQKEGGTKPELTQEEKETLTPEQQKEKLAEKEKQQLKGDEWACAQEIQKQRVPVVDRTKYYRLCMGSKGWKEEGR